MTQHSEKGIHALDGNAYRRHKDALANFNKKYIKEEIFPRTLGRKLLKQKKYGMLATMMISILQQEKKQTNRLPQP